MKESGEIESLGAIDGQIYHHMARRMERVGASWSAEGARRMARPLATKANGELSRWKERNLGEELYPLWLPLLSGCEGRHGSSLQRAGRHRKQPDGYREMLGLVIGGSES